MPSIDWHPRAIAVRTVETDQMKIYVLLGHPDPESFNGQIADAYKATAQAKGHEVRLQKLGEMRFDPILGKATRSFRSSNRTYNKVRKTSYGAKNGW